MGDARDGLHRRRERYPGLRVVHRPQGQATRKAPKHRDRIEQPCTLAARQKDNPERGDRGRPNPLGNATGPQKKQDAA